jgi:predicted cobalt transporter CbtA
MLIDRTHRGWIVGCIVALAFATAVYVPYARSTLHGPTGGSVLGLTYGIIGFALMIFAGLLGARRKVPMWRVGRAASRDSGPNCLGQM